MNSESDRLALLREYAELFYRQGKTARDEEKMADICVSLDLTAEEAQRQGDEALNRVAQFEPKLPFNPNDCQILLAS